jgi:hypothetical protein
MLGKEKDEKDVAVVDALALLFLLQLLSLSPSTTIPTVVEVEAG